MIFLRFTPPPFTGEVPEGRRGKASSAAFRCSPPPSERLRRPPPPHAGEGTNRTRLHFAPYEQGEGAVAAGASQRSATSTIQKTP